MPLYRDYRASSVYFMLFIGSGAFVAMNLILVVVLSEYRNSKRIHTCYSCYYCYSCFIYVIYTIHIYMHYTCHIHYAFLYTLFMFIHVYAV